VCLRVIRAHRCSRMPMLGLPWQVNLEMVDIIDVLRRKAEEEKKAAEEGEGGGQEGGREKGVEGERGKRVRRREGGGREVSRRKRGVKAGKSRQMLTRHRPAELRHRWTEPRRKGSAQPRARGGQAPMHRSMELRGVNGVEEGVNGVEGQEGVGVGQWDTGRQRDQRGVQRESQGEGQSGT